VKSYSVSFGGIPDKYSSWKSSLFVMVPFPIDLTTTYVSGTRNGPRAIIEASGHMELFDEENKIEPYRAGIFVSTDIPVLTTGPLAMLKELEKRIKALIRAG
jgi:agmatinase